MDYNYFEDEQDEANENDYIMEEDLENYIDVFTQSIDNDFFNQWQPLQIKQIITDAAFALESE